MKVIAIIDVGKTNKKLFLFDEDYNLVYERSARFTETTDEDGDPCENIESLRLSVFDSLRDVFRKKEFEIKALNFSTYGASFVYVDDEDKPLTPLYNYLKAYPEDLKKQFYETYGGQKKFSLETASPVLGSLNSGMQFYRLKYEQPEIFEKVRYAFHLPQYLSYIVSGKPYSDVTSIGCHTGMWNFEKGEYHEWIRKENIIGKLPFIAPSTEVVSAAFPGNTYKVGIGLHDSSAALIPYLMNFTEPFVLISTGTWCISLNPFNQTPLTAEELEDDSLCYLTYESKPVKASRVFSGFDHETQVERIAAHFNNSTAFYRNLEFNKTTSTKLQKKNGNILFNSLKNRSKELLFKKREMPDFSSAEEAYHQLILDIVSLQLFSTQLVLQGTKVKRIFVDGGFSKNSIYMNLLTYAFPGIEIYGASMAQATAIGAALAIHSSWNEKSVPSNIIELRYYAAEREKIK